MRILLASSMVAAVGLAASPVLAGGTVAAPPAEPMVFAPATPLYDWTGFSGGVQLGYGDVDTNAGVDGEGALYGLRAYYDYDFGTFILGGGVQYDWADIDLDTGAGVTAATAENVLRVGLRAGFDSGRNFYYATGGYAEADVDLAGGGSDDSDGYFVGLGYEVFLTDTVTAGAELLYHEFDSFDGALAGTDADATTASLSINYRF